MSNATSSGGVCWWCCMRLLEKCLPRNDIVRELAPYLQHVHHDDTIDEESRRQHGDESGLVSLTDNTGRVIQTPVGIEFVAFDDSDRSRLSMCLDSRPTPPMLHSTSISGSDGVDEIVEHKQNASTPQEFPIESTTFRKKRNNDSLLHADNSSIDEEIAPSTELLPPPVPLSIQDSSTDISLRSMSVPINESPPSDPPLQKKSSLSKIKTDLGDLVRIRWEKVVIVQVSVQGFREMISQQKELMEEAKLLYEHTVLSRLQSEYGGQEILSHPRSGIFVIAFASEFHAAKWCLSLQLSLVYAAWNDKLLKLLDDVKEEYVRQGGRSRKNILLHRGFRVRMVIHTADSDTGNEKSLANAVKWTNTVSEFAHGGQIVLSDNVWDRLKEQLVQLGNPVVEDLGCHALLGEEVMLMQLLPRDLERRRFPKLKSPQQLYPGMRDAPSALKPLTMVFTFIEGARPLVRCHVEELAERIKTLCIVARQLLRKHNGYECQELQGDFMLAFFSPVCAILWCCEFQLRIREKFREWNLEKEDQDLMFSMSIGVEVGTPASVSPHKTSGRADYFGNIVNQTARIAKAAHGGQILIGGDAWNAFNAHGNRSQTSLGKDEPLTAVEGSTILQFKFHGYYAFKGISLPIGLIEAIPIESTHHTWSNLTASGNRASKVVPKAKFIEESKIPPKKKTTIASVPYELVRLNHQDQDNVFDTIRATEARGGAQYLYNWDDTVQIIEEIGSDNDDTESNSSAMNGSAAMAMSQNTSSNSLQLLRSTNLAGTMMSPKTEQMERI